MSWDLTISFISKFPVPFFKIATTFSFRRFTFPESFSLNWYHKKVDSSIILAQICYLWIWNQLFKIQNRETSSRFNIRVSSALGDFCGCLQFEVKIEQWNMLKFNSCEHGNYQGKTLIHLNNQKFLSLRIKQFLSSSCSFTHSYN